MMRRRLETLAYWASLATAHTICWLLDTYDRLRNAHRR